MGIDAAHTAWRGYQGPNGWNQKDYNTYVGNDWGVEAQYWSDCLKATPEEIANLPSAAWKGEVNSNPIWIEVAGSPRGKGPQ
jgi:hypothetical protein